ncbi:MAG: hypothetical protein JWP69_2417 [Flaviaesturariibacter sp.]|nr:hypothetical protein [Flaviaesturariibacter sp.]
MQLLTRSQSSFFTLLLLMITGFIFATGSLISLSYMDGGAKIPKAPVIQRFDSSVKNLRSVPIMSTAYFVRQDSQFNVLVGQYQAFKIAADVRPKGLKPPAAQKFTEVSNYLDSSLRHHLSLLSRQKDTFLQRYAEQSSHYRKYLNELENRFRNEQDKLPSLMLSDYGQKLIAHFHKLSDESTYQNNFAQYAVNYSNYWQAVQAGDKKLQKLYAVLDGGGSVDTLNAFKVLEQFPPTKSYSFSAIAKDAAAGDWPAADKVGKDWGWIGFLFSWIVAPNNLDFVLLVGMLGFGLFGAGISVYLGNSQLSALQITADNLMLIIVRGFSASIVVFLSMRGGIAILNGGESNPNPLILFLFCFTGAVFSEPIWAWARQRVVGAFPTDGGMGRNAAADLKGSATPDEQPLPDPANLGIPVPQPVAKEKEEAVG